MEPQFTYKPGDVVCAVSVYETWKLAVEMDSWPGVPDALTVLIPPTDGPGRVASWSDNGEGRQRAFHSVYNFEIRPYPTIKMIEAWKSKVGTDAAETA